MPSRSVPSTTRSTLHAGIATTMLSGVLACLGAGAAAAPGPRPAVTLVVQITVDQLRGDLLRDFPQLRRAGLRRLTAEGTWFRHGVVDHAVTLSWPGHATLATGLHPAHHGWSANEWWRERAGRFQPVDVAEDAACPMLGDRTTAGSSPRSLQGTTLGDWVKASHAGARAIALGTGGGIPAAYAGRTGDGAFWYDADVDGFTSSTCLAARLPAWLTDFNARGLPRFRSRHWRASLRGDSGRVHFAHAFEPGKDGGPASFGAWFAGTPLKDEALFALAAVAVRAERLGQRGVLDSLALDVDSTDGAGHEYGARSAEQLDAVRRLDRALGRFLRVLDREVGRGRYVVALSADHGVADTPAAGRGRRVRAAEIEALLDRVEAAVVAHPEAPRRVAAEVLASADFVGAVYAADALGPEGDPYRELFRHSLRGGEGYTTDFPLWSAKPRPHHPARYGLMVRFTEGAVFDAAVGVHGSPYAYDRDVPIVFYGPGFGRLTLERGARTVDVAPTLAAALGIEAPAGLDGRVLAEVLTPARR